MKLFRIFFLCSLVLTLFLLFNFDSNSVNALEGSKSKVVEKVKCKEQVDEALRQYWDKDGNAVESPDAGANEEEDDEDENDTRENSDDDEDDNNNSQPNSDNNTGEEEDEEEEQEESNDNDESDEDNKKASTAADTEEESDESNESAQDNKSDEVKQNDSKNNDEEDSADSSQKVKGNSNPSATDSDDDSDESQESNNNSSDNDADKDSEQNSNEGQQEEEEIDEEELLKQQHQQKRSRAHIDDVLQVYEIGSKDDNTEQNLIQSIFRDLKRIFEGTVKPLESIYKYRQITTRLISDAEIFSKPMLLFLGGKSTGKSSLINYLLGVDDTPWQIKTGAASQTKFTILSYGENYTHLSPTELSADNTFSSLQRFGDQFLAEYIDAHRLPINILQKLTIVDSPGLIDMSPTRTAKQIIDNDVYQWFIDRSDVIYIVIDVSQLYLSSSLRVLLDQLKGREIRFVISKSDIASHSQIISMMGQLLWVLSPIMSAERPPLVYALTTLPQESFDEFLDDQETSWLTDLSTQLSGISRIESHIAEVRRHAVRVRNHAKLIDCYLSTYYKNKGLFTFGASSRQLAADISENPHQYRIYSGAFMGQLQNVSRYDLPDPGVYREFFRSNPLIDFKPLSSTCSYFRGCPIDKLDIAIAYDLPELVGKYKKLTKAKLDQH